MLSLSRSREVQSRSDASKRKEKQKWAIEKPKLDNARRLRGIYFNDPGDEEFKRKMKNARRKLEIPMPAVEKMGKIGENTGMAADKSQKQERSDR